MALRHPGTLSDKAAARLTEQFSRSHAGPESAGKAILLEEGMDASVLQPLALADAAYIESRNFSIQEVSRIYGVPVPLLSEHSKSTYSNVTQLMKQYVDACLSHHAAIWASEIQFKLLSPDQFLDIDLSYVMRGSFGDEITALTQAVVSGIMTPNECRHRLGLNPIEGLDKTQLMPGATINEEDGERDPLDPDN